MAYLVEVPTGDGTTVLLAVRDVDEGLLPAARPGHVVAKAAGTLGDMLARLRPVAETFIAQFRSMSDQPDEITVEFGVTLSAEADVVIASTRTEANFAVTLSWTNRR